MKDNTILFNLNKININSDINPIIINPIIIGF